MADNENVDVIGETGGQDGDSQEIPVADVPNDNDDNNEVLTNLEYGINIVTDDISINPNDESYSDSKNIVYLMLPSTFTSVKFKEIVNSEDKISLNIPYSEQYSISEDDDWLYRIRLSELFGSKDNQNNFQFLESYEDKSVLTFELSDNQGQVLYIAYVFLRIYENYITMSLITKESNVNTTVSESNTEGDATSNLVVDKNKDKIFQARVFHEKNKQVYGAEIILFDDEKDVIDTILITDKSDFDSYASLVDNLQQAYTPLTKQDADNLLILQRLASGDISETSEEYKNMTWSNLHSIRYLDDILKNINQSVEINATTLNGFNSGQFAKSTDVPDTRNFLNKNEHYSDEYKLPATTQRHGHAIIVDNLNTNDVSDGKVLSAKQGYILNNNIKSVDNKISNTWNAKTKKNDYLTYRVNPFLRLVVCNYNRKDYKGLKSEIGKHILHKAGAIPEAYRPTSRVITSLYRGDVTLYYNTDGSVNIYNLTKHNSINIHAQVMWHY